MRGFFQETVFGLCEHIDIALSVQPSGFPGTNLVEGLVQVGHQVEAVEDVQSLGRLLCDDLQIELSHIRADVADLAALLGSELPKTPQ